MTDLIKREDAIKAIEEWAVNLGNPKMLVREDAILALKDIPSAENKGEWITKSVETYELPEGQIVVEYDASGVGLISRECMEMLIDTLAANEPKQGEWKFISIDLSECSECGGYGKDTMRFCPNCGARMKGADDEHDK